MTSTPSILIVEDSGIIAVCLADDLLSAGYVIAGAFPTCSAACRWLKNNSPDVALLDYSLQDGPCTQVAEELHRRSIPFAVISGRSKDVVETHPAFAAAPWIEKPATSAIIERVLASLTSAPPDRSAAAG